AARHRPPQTVRSAGIARTRQSPRARHRGWHCPRIEGGRVMLIISRITGARRVEYDLSRIQIDGRPAAELEQHILYRRIAALKVPNIAATMGKQELLTVWASHLSQAIA